MSRDALRIIRHEHQALAILLQAMLQLLADSRRRSLASREAGGSGAGSAGPGAGVSGASSAVDGAAGSAVTCSSPAAVISGAASAGGSSRWRPTRIVTPAITRTRMNAPKMYQKISTRRS